MSAHAIADTSGLAPIPPVHRAGERSTPERILADRPDEPALGVVDGSLPQDAGGALMVNQIHERIRQRYYLDPAVTEHIIDRVARDIEAGHGSPEPSDGA